MSNRRRLTDGGDGGGGYDPDPYIRAAAMNERLAQHDPAQAKRVFFFVKDGEIKLGMRPEYRQAVRSPRNRLGRTYSQAEVDRIAQQKGRLLSMAMDMGAIVQGSDGAFRPA